MANFEFKFKPDQLNFLIDRNKGHNLVASLYSFEHYPNKGKHLFFGLQTCDSVTNDPETTNVLVVRACPAPPGWGATIENIPHSHLINCPKFVIPAAEKDQLKTTNENDSVTVNLESDITPDGLGITFIAKFRAKDVNGTVIGAVDAKLL